MLKRVIVVSPSLVVVRRREIVMTIIEWVFTNLCLEVVSQHEAWQWGRVG